MVTFIWQSKLHSLTYASPELHIYYWCFAYKCFLQTWCLSEFSYKSMGLHKSRAICIFLASLSVCLFISLYACPEILTPGDKQNLCSAVMKFLFYVSCRNLVSASQDGKLIVWDGYTTNKVSAIHTWTCFIFLLETTRTKLFAHIPDLAIN